MWYFIAKPHLLPTDSCLSVVRLKWWFVPPINLKNNRIKHIFITTTETSKSSLHSSSWQLKFYTYTVDEIRISFFSLTNDLCKASHLANLSKKNKTEEVRNKMIFVAMGVAMKRNFYISKQLLQFWCQWTLLPTLCKICRHFAWQASAEKGGNATFSHCIFFMPSMYERVVYSSGTLVFISTRSFWMSSSVQTINGQIPLRILSLKNKKIIIQHLM